MNSFYKKIALVCLVSLTATQPAQAFQLSDILNWIKVSRTVSVAVAAGIAACVVLTLFNSRKSLVVMKDDQKIAPVYKTYVSDHVFDDGVAPKLFPTIYKFSALSETYKDALKAQCRSIKSDMGTKKSKQHITVITDQNEKIVGCISFKVFGSSVWIEKCVSQSISMDAKLLNPFIATGTDIRFVNEDESSVRCKDLGTAIAEYDKIAPKIVKFGYGTNFDRSEARKKRKQGQLEG